ncbi:MAG: DinB family protein [Acidobacteriota bacterium]
MFRKIDDFERHWQQERETTLKVFKTLTDASLSQAVSSEDRNLGRIAWHITQAIPEMMGHVGLKVDGPAMDVAVPTRAADICAAYERASKSVLELVKAQWKDDTLLIEDDLYGERWSRGFTLVALIGHEVHHRGQMSVLMRQAGLVVPGIYGPAREEWVNYGMAAPAI